MEVFQRSRQLEPIVRFDIRYKIKMGSRYSAPLMVGDTSRDKAWQARRERQATVASPHDRP